MKASVLRFTKTALCTLTLLVLALGLCASAFAAGNSKFIRDKYDLLDSSIQTTLETQAKEIASNYNVGTYLLIVDDIGSKSARDYAKNYWNKKDLGLGSNKSGILLLVAVDSRDYVTITHGQAVLDFTDWRIGEIEDDIVNYLSDNEWQWAFQAYLDDCQETLEYKAEYGTAMGYDKDSTTSSANSMEGISEVLTMPFVIALIIALIVMICVRLALKAQLKSVKAQDTATAFMDRPVDITRSEQRFGGTVVTKTPIPKSSSSSGGSGGSWSGSGGFGGSSGGKF